MTCCLTPSLKKTVVRDLFKADGTLTVPMIDDGKNGAEIVPDEGVTIVQAKKPGSDGTVNANVDATESVSVVETLEYAVKSRVGVAPTAL